MSYIEGSIIKYLYYNEDNSYSAIKIRIFDTDDEDLIHFEPTIVVCGFFPKLDLHANYRFIGEVTHHNKYGIQYMAKQFERVMDNTYSGLVDYLSSDLFKGIGKKTAEKIVDKLGVTALDQIANDLNVLDGIPRMTSALKKNIYKQIVENRDMENTLVWLYGFQISPKMAMRIYSVYGLKTIETIKNNPYVLIETVENIGFRRADEIGLKVGFEYDSPLRISAVIYFLLTEYMNKYGDTFLEKEKLIEYTLKYLNTNQDIEISSDKIYNRLADLINEGKIIEKGENLSLSYLYYAERYIANKIMLFNRKVIANESLIAFADYLDNFEKINEINYTLSQQKAIKMALNNYFSIITGGPGTGKTTVIKGIVDIYKMIYHCDDESILLAAPTGKAAKRLGEATGITAYTIHKMLGYDFTGNFQYDENNLLEAKLIIVDEVSMMDCLLAKRLLSAISNDTQIVFVGDADQLPSVGPGEVLNDLIKSDLFNVVELNVIHRQAVDSKIISLAYDILNKNINRSLFDKFDDREFISSKDQYVANEVINVIKGLIKQGYSLKDDIQVLIPVYKGFNGIDRINSLIQSYFNSQNKDFVLEYKDKVFWNDDKVMQLVNQPEDNIMNGDQGIIASINIGEEIVVDFSGNLVKYNVKDLENLTLAYAISIHKAQGSEFKAVIIPMVKSYSIMLKRKLLYTAVTRAKEKLIIIGDFQAYKRGVLGMDIPRKTLLKQFLEEKLQNSSNSNLTIEDFL